MEVYSDIYKRKIRTKLDYIYNNSIKNNNLWEPEIIESIKKYLQPNTDFLDIGAHIGLITLGVSELDNVNKIHSFEVDNENFSYLKFNTSDIDKINLYNFGLSDSQKLCTINENIYNSGCNYINNTYHSSEKKGYEYTWTTGVQECYLNNNNIFYSIIL
jgi:FkbM family methyltransferase